MHFSFRISHFRAAEGDAGRREGEAGPGVGCRARGEARGVVEGVVGGEVIGGENLKGRIGGGEVDLEFLGERGVAID